MAEKETFVRDTRPPRPKAPPGSWDCQVHVYGDPARFPPRAQSAYAPPRAYFEDVHRMASTLGMGYVSIVQASVYGADHSALLDALSRGDGGVYEGVTYRGIAIVNDDVSDKELLRLHEAGVRGARFNFWRRLNVTPTVPEFLRSIERISQFGWHARVHVTEPELLELQPVFAAAKGTFVIDHMGHLPFADGLQQPGARAILDLLRRENWWVMLSHGDRSSATEHPWDDAIPFTRAYFEAARDRSVWATDWPHPEYPKTPVNDAELVELMHRCLPDAREMEAVFVTNPKRLHGEPA
ncbi:2-pyrone-4,6-dicarbaxylate hydrolase [Pigmentiphaga humi]|uniref:2-pyrone-4,6-dicarbaxylate hydrolase n=1 Tax=Pigmentiphaga humi TaxID=2478468 RepID=A0A3P4B103_9BURK|nr:amidohydrolase family protein [Pigmentiphaga humi]VCU69236.1 2-pyrone-4,6-dicarbaxylate hydrolase [Pigmentiphaga humi]